MSRVGFILCYTVGAAIHVGVAADITGKIVGTMPHEPHCQRDDTMVVYAAPIQVPGPAVDRCTKVYQTKADYDRGYQFEALPVGKYLVTGLCGNGYSVHFSVAIEATTVRAGKTSNVPINIMDWNQVHEVPRSERKYLPQLPLVGLVRAADGRPVQGASIAIHYMDFDPIDDTDRSDADGSFGFCSVTTGKVTMTVSAPGYESQTLQIDHGWMSLPPVVVELKRK